MKKRKDSVIENREGKIKPLTIHTKKQIINKITLSNVKREAGYTKKQKKIIKKITISDDKREDDLYDDLIEDLGIKKREDDLYDYLIEDFGIKKREDDLFDDLIEDFGRKNDKNIFFSYLSLWL